MPLNVGTYRALLGHKTAALPILDLLSQQSDAAYGLRQLRSAYTGPLIRIRRSSDNAETDIGFTTSALVRQNLVPNPTGSGASAGTPGTLPTGWTLTNVSGLSSTVVGTGTQALQEYVDIRINGVPLATGTARLVFCTSTAVPSVTSDQTISSFGCRFTAGAITNATFSVTVNENDSGGAFLRRASQTFTPQTDFVLTLAIPNTNGASTAFVQPELSMGVTISQAVDITLRLYLPNLVKGAYFITTIPLSSTNPTVVATAGSLDLDAINTFANATANQTLFITTWYDQSVNVQHAVDTFVTAQPILAQTSALISCNKKPAMWMAASQPNAGLTPVGTLTPPGLTMTGNIVSLAPQSGSNGGLCWEVGASDFNAPSWLMFYKGSTTALSQFRTSGAALYNPPVLNDLTTPFVNTISMNAGLNVPYLNGVIKPSSSLTGTTFSTGRYRIGRSQGRPFNSMMSELICAFAVLGDVDRQLLERNQGAYYGITVA